MCVLGSSYESVLDEACIGIYEGLDKCLPQSDATDIDETTSSCAEEEGLLLGKLNFIGMDSSVLTRNRMPKFCLQIFEEKLMDITEIQSRLDYYNKNREYGWTLETTANDAKVGVEEAPEVEASEQPQDSYESKSTDILTVESLGWEDGEAATVDDSTSVKAKLFPFIIAGLAIAGAVALVLVVKYSSSTIRARMPTSTPKADTPRKEYAHVAVKMGEFA